MIKARLALVAALVLTPATASAASLEDTAGSGPAAEGYFVYTAAKGERNRLTVANGHGRGIVFTDPGARMHRVKGDFGNCSFSRDRHRAVCDEPSDTDVVVRLGDRGDSIRFTGDNSGQLGPTARTEAFDADELGDIYGNLEGGNANHAFVLGGPGNDVLRGTNQSDRLEPGRGADRVDGGEGDDRIVDRPDGATDRLRGGRGIDTVDGVGRAPLTIDLRARTFSGAGDTDTLDSFERGRGGPGDDTLEGRRGADGLFGDNGDDKIDGGAGSDYLGGDLGLPGFQNFGRPGRDKLTGGRGDDVLDGRDSGDGVLTPTDRLVCGKGADRILALQDDLADPSCESSAFGVFSGDPSSNGTLNLDALSSVAPTTRGGDGAPTYRIACAPVVFGPTQEDCSGRVQLERPPVTGADGEPEVLGSSAFEIKSGAKEDVPVTLNEAGKAALAQQEAAVSVHVLIEYRPDLMYTVPRADFGWQQVLGPS